MSVLSSWVELAAAPSRAQPIVRHANEAECAAIAEALGIPGCRSLTARYSIAALNRGRYRLSGEIAAVLVQNCVVTLEPFDQPLNAPFEIEFWPADQLMSEGFAPESSREIEVDPLAGEDPEPIINGRLEIGPLLYQFLAAAIDPFPRHPDAELERTEADAPDRGRAEHPFAALHQLKRDEDGSPTEG
jgi:Large ribosomal RNA subunit accumulation protein YceD